MTDPSVRTALVTGAARGIGYAVAARLRAAGARVALVDVDTDEVADAAEQLGGPPDVVGHGADVRATDAIAAWLDDLDFLPDILVNNAGVGPRIPALELTPQQLTEIMAINFEAAVHLARRIAGRLIAAQRPGAIVNVSSVNAFRGTPEMLHYNASKAALVSATRTMAVEWAPHAIRVNAVCPGSTRTRIWDHGGWTEEERQRFAARNPLGRLAEPEEIAAAVAFLVSDEASFITGHALVADAGLTAML